MIIHSQLDYRNCPSPTYLSLKRDQIVLRALLSMACLIELFGCGRTNIPYGPWVDPQGFYVLPIDSSSYLVANSWNGGILEETAREVPEATIEDPRKRMVERCATIATSRGYLGFRVLHSHEHFHVHPREYYCYHAHRHSEDCQVILHRASVSVRALIRLIDFDPSLARHERMLNSTSTIVDSKVPYGPKKDIGTGFSGYSEAKHSPNIWEISYEGGSGPLTELRLLYRAAQVALLSGHDSFALLDYKTPSILKTYGRQIIYQEGATLKSAEQLGTERLTQPNLGIKIRVLSGENRDNTDVVFEALDILQTVSPLLDQE